METATVINVASRTFKTRKGAQSEMDRSIEWALSSDSAPAVIEHEGGFAFALVSEHPVERVRTWLAAGQITDAVFA